jgi:choline-sulfatase
MRPANVLFIFSDQHSRRVFGCYGNAAARTPALDALAARGTRFASAYCQTPICVPSRASLATGRWAHAVDSWDNATPYVGTEARSWGHRLTAKGHRVTTIGKLHYRKVDDPSGFPDQRVPMHVLEGVGDLYGLLRGDMPERPQSRTQVLEARAGESEYIRYDRAIADGAVRWLREEATAERKPWCLFVGFVSPHFPLVVPDQYWNLYDPDALPLPVQHAPEHWSRHPVLELKRRQEALDAPFDQKTVRNAMRAYYGLVSFLDEQVGLVAGRAPGGRACGHDARHLLHRPRRDARRARALVEERDVRERGRGAPHRGGSRRAGRAGGRDERDARRRVPLDPGGRRDPPRGR